MLARASARRHPVSSPRRLSPWQEAGSLIPSQRAAARRGLSTAAPKASAQVVASVPPATKFQPYGGPGTLPGGIAPQEKHILRNFFAECLYKRTESYFAKNAPVIELTQPFDFNNYWSHEEYQKALYETFQDQDGFMTPVEIFKPYYGEAVARYIVDILRRSRIYDPETQKSSFTPQQPLSLIEIGAGNGSCAVAVLDFLQREHPVLYENVKYTIIDVSGPFIERQKKTLASHGSRVTIEHSSVFDYNKPDAHPGFVIALELLDNLPHDKLVTDNYGVIKESWVSVYPANSVLDTEDRLKLPVQPLMGALTKKIINHQRELEAAQASQPVSTEPMRETFALVSDLTLVEALEKVCHHAGLDSAFLKAQLKAEKPKEFGKENIRLWHHLQYPDTTKIEAEFEALQASLDVREKSDAMFTPQQVSALVSKKESAPPASEATDTKSAEVATASQLAYQQALTKTFKIKDILKWTTVLQWRRTASMLFSQTNAVSAERILYFPTLQYSLLKKTKTLFPNKELIFADFDIIPGAMAGINGPLVQRTQGNVTSVYKSYLTPPRGYCDIFFPTNFELLQVLYREVYSDLGSGFTSTHVGSKQFLKKFADTKRTRTKSGYNPMLQDFVNTRFFLTAGF